MGVCRDCFKLLRGGEGQDQNRGTKGPTVHLYWCIKLECLICTGGRVMQNHDNSTWVRLTILRRPCTCYTSYLFLVGLFGRCNRLSSSVFGSREALSRFPHLKVFWFPLWTAVLPDISDGAMAGSGGTE